MNKRIININDNHLIMRQKSNKSIKVKERPAWNSSGSIEPNPLGFLDRTREKTKSFKEKSLKSLNKKTQDTKFLLESTITPIEPVIDEHLDEIKELDSIETIQKDEKQSEIDDYFESLSTSDETTQFINQIAPKNVMVRCKLVKHADHKSDFTIYLDNYNDYDLPLLTSNRLKSLFSFEHLIDPFKIDGRGHCHQDVSIIAKQAKVSQLGRIYSDFLRKKFNLIGMEFKNKDTNENECSFVEIKYFNRRSARPIPKYIEVEIITRTSDESRNNTDFKRHLLYTKYPDWNKKLKVFRLNIDRAFEPSKDKMQLIFENDKKNVIFQIGKVKDKSYYCDFTHPLSVFQAFGIAIAVLSR
jgi:hypothetical protein